ncbi:RidA family protein [Noviherbaspirillum sedimenti]|uniref:RidA family protein n=1 Tax=Noviherbaspirillum sedimenti TaxID=2320865 RepID=A0A3A3G8M8_9BURK|nr:RidA family protein [Noviherbaspirillum sedimenti]RJG03109.1 RidA family protein [Noviherbaspirillum sedimenti]
MISTKPWRQSFQIDGIVHKAPIPMGTRVGNMLFSSAIMGSDPQTGKLAEGGDAQARHAFANLDALLAKAGATLGDIGRMTVYIASDEWRDAINREWLARFPDPDNRPARHTIIKELPGGMLAQLDIIAVIKE